MKKACPSLVLIPALKRECSSGPASISDPDLELGVINSSTDLRGSPEQINNRHTAKIISHKCFATYGFKSDIRYLSFYIDKKKIKGLSRTLAKWI